MHRGLFRSLIPDRLPVSSGVQLQPCVCVYYIIIMYYIFYYVTYDISHRCSPKHVIASDSFIIDIALVVYAILYNLYMV